MKSSISRIWPKGRWYQFHLRTLLLAITAIAFVCGLASNFRFCIQQSEFHREKEYESYMAGHYSFRYLMGPNPDLDKHIARCMEESENHRRLREAYELAAWRPWNRLSIDHIATKVDEWRAAEFARRYPNPGDWSKELLRDTVQ